MTALELELLKLVQWCFETPIDLAPADLAPLRNAPWLVELIQQALEERDERSSLSREEIFRVHAVVEVALPHSRDDAEGFHPRPKGALEAFAFVGTGYAARATKEMVLALRDEGYDDLRILDLANSVADANQWARIHRLFGLPSNILTPSPQGRD